MKILFDKYSFLLVPAFHLIILGTLALGACRADQTKGSARVLTYFTYNNN